MSNTTNPGRVPGTMPTSGMRASRSPFVDWTTDVAAWMDQGACVNTPNPDLFYGENLGQINAAKAICHTCPVQQLCLERARELEENGYQWGVWGGMSADERRRIRARERLTQKPIVVAVTPRPPRVMKQKGKPGGPKCGTEYGARVHELHHESACDQCRDARMQARRRRKEKALA